MDPDAIRNPEDATSSGEVRDFYDRYPYPPPAVDLDHYRELWVDVDRRRADFHLLFPTTPYRDDPQVLVAGCGTSQAAKHALRHPKTPVVAIDISVTSLDHTHELKRKYDLGNLEIVELPIERVQELGRRFDKVVCTGVLHHLRDPDAGLSALRAVLAPNGAMQLMVYARYGRTGVYMLQEYCRRLGVGTQREEITALATTLAALPRAHPIAHLLGTAPDFRTPAGLADALLHPQDRAYTVPELFQWVESAGLRFGRWTRQAPYCSRCGALARSPHGRRLAAMAPEDEYAAVELFRGTMTRHGLVVYPADGPAVDRMVRFDDDRWPECVPIRLPRTVCIDDHRVPDGAAAVLINQDHTEPDLVMSVNEDEKPLFDLIDGGRTVRELVSEHSSSSSDDFDRVRSFFERLWWYDQVVFDASPRS